MCEQATADAPPSYITTIIWYTLDKYEYTVQCTVSTITTQVLVYAAYGMLVPARAQRLWVRQVTHRDD